MIQLGLLGYPISYSLSPKIHKAAMKSCGLQGEYSLFPIFPDDLDSLEELLVRVRTGEIAGLNVTIPHKQNVIPLLDVLTPTSEAVGAVNTISMQNGKLIGENTDVLGFLADLKRFIGIRKSETGNCQSSIINRKSSIILGAGGSARAVVYALLTNGWNVTVTARRPEQVQALIAQFPNPDSRITSIAYDSTALYSLLSTLSLIINTTPLGMSPNMDASPWPANLSFPPSAAVYDLVYIPHETKLVKDARAAGLPATTGMGMLIEQAALAFELWTGCTLSRDILWQAIEN